MAKTVILAKGVSVITEKQGVLTKMAKVASLHSTHQRKHFAHPTPKNDENGRWHSCRSMVYQKRGFRNPDKRLLLSEC